MKGVYAALAENLPAVEFFDLSLFHSFPFFSFFLRFFFLHPARRTRRFCLLYFSERSLFLCLPLLLKKGELSATFLHFGASFFRSTNV